MYFLFSTIHELSHGWLKFGETKWQSSSKMVKPNTFAPE